MAARSSVLLSSTKSVSIPALPGFEVRFIAGTGLRRLYRPILDALEAQAESLDCISIAGFERKGWSRFGFEIIGVSLVRRLKD